MSSLHALVLLNKPSGISSNQALQKVKRLFAVKKAGHTGSLDVLASGMLPICLGEAVKFSQFLLNADKRYVTTARLGQATSTCDAEGDVIVERCYEHIDQALINRILPQFIGKISQVPSMFSALKHQGQPLYKLARKGIEIDRPARQIEIYAMELLEWSKPYLSLSVHCSKGTYIRNLVDDIGKALDCVAHVSRLHRTAVGDYQASQMASLEQLADNPQRYLLPVDGMLQHYQQKILSDDEKIKLYHGQRFAIPDGFGQCLLRLYDTDKQFLGIGELDDGVLKAKRLMSAPCSG